MRRSSEAKSKPGEGRNGCHDSRIIDRPLSRPFLAPFSDPFLADPFLADPFLADPFLAVLGTAAFFDTLKVKIKALRGEKHRVRRVTGLVPLGEVRRAVERVKAESWESFEARHGDWGRDLVLCLARRHCGLTHAELAAQTGGMNAAAVGEAVRRMEQRLRADRLLRKKAAEAVQML